MRPVQRAHDLKLSTHTWNAPLSTKRVATILTLQAGDVAARAGVRPAEAEAVLQALAYDAGGTLEVSQEVG
jgi:hypothetical protein